MYVAKRKHNIAQQLCFGQKMDELLSSLIKSNSVFGKARLDAA